MSSEYQSNDFPAPVEVCKCGRYASIDCMIAVSNGYKCISCVEKELYNRVPDTLLDEIQELVTGLKSSILDKGISTYSAYAIANDIEYILSKYRKEENE